MALSESPCQVHASPRARTQSSTRPSGVYRPGTVEKEFGQAFPNVRNNARAAGFSLAEFVTVHMALAEIEDYQTVNRAHREAFAEVPNLPARLTYQAGALPFGCKVAVQAIAAHS